MVTFTNREENVLKYIVEDFVATGIPVGSKYLCKQHDLSFSSATIRNIMVKLEDLGLVFQPHVSAGRIPTDSGYRVYVDCLMSIEQISQIERQRVLKDLRKVAKDFHQMLEKSSKILGEISNQLGIVLMPKMFNGVFIKLELVPISERRILLVISIKSGLLKTATLELDFDVTREILELTTQILNERLSGLTLDEIRKTINMRLKSVTTGHLGLLSYFKKSANKIFDFDDMQEYYFGGARNILRQNEFATTEKFDNLMEFLESKKNTIHFFTNLNKSKSCCVSIGSENSYAKLENFSFVASDYNYGNVKGVLGIIGPTRMDYPRMISIVNYMSNAISKFASNRVLRIN